MDLTQGSNTIFKTKLKLSLQVLLGYSQTKLFIELFKFIQVKSYSEAVC